MVFDGRELTSFDTQLLSDLQNAHSSTPGVPIDPLGAEPSGPRRRGSRRARDRRTGAIVMTALVAMTLIAAGLGVAARQSGGHGQRVSDEKPVTDAKHAKAMTMVASALDQSVAANHFDFDYRIVETPVAHPKPAPQVCVDTTKNDAFKGPNGLTLNGKGVTTWLVPPPGRPSASTSTSTSGTQRLCYTPTELHNVVTSGSGTTNVDPKQLSVSAKISSGLDVQVSLTGDQIKYSETGVSSGGQLLSTFASLVTGSLGPREGALAMTQMASPAGYLDLEKEAVTDATAAGTGTVDGVAVTNFDVSVDLTRLLLVPGLTADEQTSIQQALDLLRKEGLTDTTVRVSIDAAGFIRQIDAVTNFADGGKVTYDATYRNFACSPTSPTSPTTVPCDTIPPPTTAPTQVSPSSSAPGPSTTTSTSDAPASTEAPTRSAPSTTAPPATTTAPN
jgi:hypothetical protein